MQKAEQLMVAKYFSLIKYAGSTLDNYDRLYDVNTCSYSYHRDQSSEFCDEFLWSFS